MQFCRTSCAWLDSQSNFHFGLFGWVSPTQVWVYSVVTWQYGRPLRFSGIATSNTIKALWTSELQRNACCLEDYLLSSQKKPVICYSETCKNKRAHLQRWKSERIKEWWFAIAKNIRHLDAFPSCGFSAVCPGFIFKELTSEPAVETQIELLF